MRIAELIEGAIIGLPNNKTAIITNTPVKIRTVFNTIEWMCNATASDGNKLLLTQQEFDSEFSIDDNNIYFIKV